MTFRNPCIIHVCISIIPCSRRVILYTRVRKTHFHNNNNNKKNTADRFSLKKKRTYNTTPAHNNITRVRCSLCAVHFSYRLWWENTLKKRYTNNACMNVHISQGNNGLMVFHEREQEGRQQHIYIYFTSCS